MASTGTVQTKITTQGQVSIPISVRAKLGLNPGSVVEWVEEADGKITVRRAGSVTFADIHKAVFGDRKPQRASLEDMREAIERHVIKEYAGD